jgi:monofunctional biosynthetic peptidoglycan transglycosylase
MSSRYREHLSIESLSVEDPPQVEAHSPSVASAPQSLSKRVRAFLYYLVLGVCALQLYFFIRIVMMNWIDPDSTSFQRSEIVRILKSDTAFSWKQQWVEYDKIANSAKRAVITSEDAEFVEHSGVDWKALEAAAERNAQAQAKAQKELERLEVRQAKNKKVQADPPAPPKAPTAKIVGGSTITQQLAKNLFLSGERNFVRKGQEVVITFMLEAVLSKRRILEIYLNSVEWGEGIFGIEAAAQFYFKKSASQLSNFEAARLAVMLPRPRFYQKKPRSAYLTQRASRIAAQLNRVELP